MTNDILENAIHKGINFLHTSQQYNGGFLSLSSSRPYDFKKAKTYRSTFHASLIFLSLTNIEQAKLYASLRATERSEAIPSNTGNVGYGRDCFVAPLRSTPRNDSTFAKQIKNMEAKLASFLLRQKSARWTFNYWERNSKESKLLPYPDDLDDTFCALAALTRYNSKLIGAAAMADIVRLLTALEQKPGGPYRTWLVSKHADKIWQDVDLAVNSNITYFLLLHDISLPGLQSFMERAIVSKSYTSPYYPSVYPLLYFISRAYQGKKRGVLQSFSLEKMEELSRDNSLRNPLHTALLINSFFNSFELQNTNNTRHCERSEAIPSNTGNVSYGRDCFVAPLRSTPRNDNTIPTLDRHIEYLLRTQRKNGSWQASAFCIDPAMYGKIYYSGSRSLTTAYCVEALSKYYANIGYSGKKTVASKTIHVLQETKQITKTIIARAKQRCAHFDKDLTREYTAMLDIIIKKDKDGQIALMPYFFMLALKPQYRDIPREYIVLLGAANLYGWIAYTIYDDFLDEEGTPKLLPVANICLRELIQIYEHVFQNNEPWKDFFHDIIDTIEMANAWEVSHCRMGRGKFIPPRYGNFSRLAERSIGHALGPLAILSYLGYGTSSPEVKNLKQFFIHFLIARQLFDDAHDWEQDLKKGHVNSVGAMLVQKYHGIDFQENSAILRKLFWHEIIVKVIKTVRVHLAQAKQELKKIPVINKGSLIEKLINPIEASAKNTLTERKNTMEFLKKLK